MLLTEKLCEPKAKPHRVIAHRGMSGKFPENTLLAFDAVRHEGLRWIETDVSMLADETLIVFHDEAQGRTVAGDKLVADAKWEDFQNADAGAWKGEQFLGQKVLRLETLISWAAVHDMVLILEMKCHGNREYRSAELLASSLRKIPKENIVVSSFNIHFLRFFRMFAPHIPRASIHNFFPEDIYLLRNELAIEAVHLDSDLIATSTDVTVFHQQGIKIRAWTVNDPSRALDLFNLGVDMVMSDYPEQI
jgi:glycerophosphoryl diester phosphodiesterase